MKEENKPTCFGNHGCNYPDPCNECDYEHECEQTMPDSPEIDHEALAEMMKPLEVEKREPKSTW